MLVSCTAWPAQDWALQLPQAQSPELNALPALLQPDCTLEGQVVHSQEVVFNCQLPEQVEFVSQAHLHWPFAPERFQFVLLLWSVAQVLSVKLHIEHLQLLFGSRSQ